MPSFGPTPRRSQDESHSHIPTACPRHAAKALRSVRGMWRRVRPTLSPHRHCEHEAAAALFQLAFRLQTRLRILAARFARALLRHSTLKSKRAQGRPGAGWHPRSAARRCSAKEPHSSIQVVPITRPSLRDGWTAYAVLSREPSSLWPPSLSQKSPTPRRLTRMPHPQELDRSNDGQDHTVLPYARPATSPQFFQPCRRSRKLTDETKPSSAARRNEALGSRRAIRPALSLSHPNAAASTASPARERDDHKIAPQG